VCANNGTCINGTCSCPEGYGGAVCLIIQDDKVTKHALTEGSFVGIVVGVTCLSIIILSAIVAYFIVRWSRSNRSYIGQAGLDELHDISPTNSLT
jgi:hypothetical protein